MAAEFDNAGSSYELSKMQTPLPNVIEKSGSAISDTQQSSIYGNDQNLPSQANRWFVHKGLLAMTSPGRGKLQDKADMHNKHLGLQDLNTSFPSTIHIVTSPLLKQKASQMATSLNKTHDQTQSPVPSTPPRTLCNPFISVRTPLSSKGVNPAALQSEGYNEDRQNLNKTPRKRSSGSGILVPTPLTPRKLIFPSNQNNSPFRTPSGIFGTPRSRAIFDPHDPSTLLDEELNRLGNTGQEDSPVGLFGKGRGSLLYDSPVLSTSPGRWWV